VFILHTHCTPKFGLRFSDALYLKRSMMSATM